MRVYGFFDSLSGMCNFAGFIAWWVFGSMLHAKSENWEVVWIQDIVATLSSAAQGTSVRWSVLLEGYFYIRGHLQFAYFSN